MNNPKNEHSTRGSRRTGATPPAPSANDRPLAQKHKRFGEIWMPPEAKGAKVPKLKSTDETVPKFDTTIEHIRGSCAYLTRRDLEPAPDVEQLSPKHRALSCLPHPGSDFHHKEVPVSISALKRLPRGDRAVYQRLGLVFDLVVCKVFHLLGAINEALEHNRLDEYNSARKAYGNYVRKFRERDPGLADIDQKEGLGYGGHFVWASIEPWIGPNQDRLNVIVGAKIQVKWNPHISSSGVPIQHKPL